MEESTSLLCNLGVLDSLSDDEIHDILNTYAQFSSATHTLLNGTADLSLQSEFVAQVQFLCHHGLESLVLNHFLRSLEENFEKNGALEFWGHFDAYEDIALLNTCNPPHSEEEVWEMLCKALEEISLKKKCQEELLSVLLHALQSCKYDVLEKGRHFDSETEAVRLFAKYQLLVSAVLMATLPRHFPDSEAENCSLTTPPDSSIIDKALSFHHSNSFLNLGEFFQSPEVIDPLILPIRVDKSSMKPYSEIGDDFGPQAEDYTSQNLIEYGAQDALTIVSEHQGASLEETYAEDGPHVDLKQPATLLPILIPWLSSLGLCISPLPPIRRSSTTAKKKKKSTRELIDLCTNVQYPSKKSSSKRLGSSNPS